MKQCTKCGELKPLSEYHKDKTKRDGHKPRCKTCASIYFQENRAEKLDKARIRNYGVTREEFDQMIKDQDGSCEICKLPFVPNKTPHVDHCHTTNRIRGLLCNHCNRGLGGFRDSIKIMQSAQEYIKKYSA